MDTTKYCTNKLEACFMKKHEATGSQPW